MLVLPDLGVLRGSGRRDRHPEVAVLIGIDLDGVAERPLVKRSVLLEGPALPVEVAGIGPAANAPDVADVLRLSTQVA